MEAGFAGGEGKSKRGRPRLNTNPVSFGMKISEEERENIRSGARQAGKSATRFIMDLVESAVVRKDLKPGWSGKELMALPDAERHQLLEDQAREAAKYYSTDPDLDFTADDPIHEG